MPQMLRSVITWPSPMASRAAVPVVAKTHFPAGTPTGSVATDNAPCWLSSTRSDALRSPGTRRVHTSSSRTRRISIRPTPLLQQHPSGR